MRAALDQGKWEGTLVRQRKNGEQFTARVVMTPRHDALGKPVGFLLISKDISDEIRLTQYARSLIEAECGPAGHHQPGRQNHGCERGDRQGHGGAS